MSDDPNPFCESLPTQLRAWDATSLRSYMKCPRRYQYEIVEGWRRDGVHTIWGSLFHSAVEEYDKARVRGLNKEDALDVAYKWALENSGEYIDAGDELWQPWGSVWTPFWRCTDEGPLRKSGPHKGEPDPRRRCVNSKHLQDGHMPAECPIDHKPVVEEWQWVHASDAKNRHTLLRAIVWYVDEQTETGGVQPYGFESGRPAVEISFQLPLPIQNPDGEPYLLCGHMDSIATFGEEIGIRERKSTQKTVGTGYFNQYSPDVQIDTYDLAGSVLFPEMLARWVMLEATQTSANFSRTQRKFIHSTEGRRDEFLRDTLYWITKAETDARAGYYPKNEASCYANGGCPFREICNRDPSTRHIWLAADFIKRHWNPLKTRGDDDDPVSPEGET